METTRETYRIQHLLVHTSPKLIARADGSTRAVAGSLVMFDNLPNTDEVKVKNVLNLTKKQLLYLARTVHINTKNEDRAINELSIAIGANRSRAVVSSTFKKKGDKFIDTTDGVEKNYSTDWYDNRIDSLILPSSFTAQLDAKVVESILGAWEEVNTFGDDTGAVAEPARTL